MDWEHRPMIEKIRPLRGAEITIKTKEFIDRSDIKFTRFPTNGYLAMVFDFRTN